MAQLSCGCCAPGLGAAQRCGVVALCRGSRMGPAVCEGTGGRGGSAASGNGGCCSRNICAPLEPDERAVWAGGEISCAGSECWIGKVDSTAKAVYLLSASAVTQANVLLCCH